MPKRKFFNFFLPTLVFCFFLSLLNWQLKIRLVFLWFGIFLGVLFWQVEHLFYIFLKAPHEYVSSRFIYSLKNKQVGKAFELLLETEDERRVFSRSVLFQLLILIMTFFVLTSTLSILGKGLTLSLFFQSLISQGKEFLKKGEISSWFWQFKRPPFPNLQALYFGVACLVFLFFSLFLV